MMTLDLGDTQPVPMGRLATVELRKALDTRAGRWFTISILALVLIVAGDLRLRRARGRAGLRRLPQHRRRRSLGYFLPILIIMLVTSETSQRTGLVTFTLEPRRSRVVVAKFIAGFVLAAAVMVLAALIAVAGTLLGMALGAECRLVGRRQPAVQRVRPRQRDRRPGRLRDRDAADEHPGRDRRLLRLQPDPADRGRHPRRAEPRLRRRRAVDRVQHRPDAALHGRLHAHRRGVGADRGLRDRSGW